MGFAPLLRVTFTVIVLLMVKPCAAELADASLQQGYRAMLLDFCAATVASKDATALRTRAQDAGIQMSDQLKLEGNPWREALVDLLGLADGESVYAIKLPQTAPGKFVIGYLPLDGRSCAVLAQDLEAIRALALQELESKDSGWVLAERGGRARAFLRGGSETSHSLLLITRDSADNGTEVSWITRYEGEVRAPTAEARAALVEKFLSTCINAVHQNSQPVFADFAGVFATKAEKKVLIAESLPQYPSAVLTLAGNKGLICSIVGGYNLGEADATRAEVERQLLALNAVPIERVANVEGSGLLVAKPADAPRRGGEAFIRIDKLVKESIFFITVYRARR